jgi:chaperone required for assembly of F1-ATPase
MSKDKSIKDTVSDDGVSAIRLSELPIDASRIPTKEMMRPPLPKKFYKAAEAAAGSEPGSYQIRLDGRPVKTPKKRALIVHSDVVAEAIVAEWHAQSGVINPATMPLTRIANTAIDAVSDTLPEVRADIVAFAGSDLVCYRAEAPVELVARQAKAWEPILKWADTALGARLAVSEGIRPVPQSERALSAIASAVQPFNALQLTALHVLTTLTGSALLALAYASNVITSEQLWTAAHIDEDWQISLWGSDEEAEQRRRLRKTEFDAACLVLAHAQ